MEQVGYQLFNDTGSVVGHWGGVWGQCPAVPDYIECPNGDRVYSPIVGENYNGVVLQPWFIDKPVNPIVPGLVFLARFTDAEYGNILQAGQTDVRIARWVDMLRLSGSIDVYGDDAAAAKQTFVSTSLLSAERADEIFAPL